MELCCEKDSPLGLHTGCDLMAEKGTQEALRLGTLHKPKVLWVSFPCGPTSPLQRLNELTEESWMKSMKCKAKSSKIARNKLRLMNLQLCQGGEVIF